MHNNDGMEFHSPSLKGFCGGGNEGLRTFWTCDFRSQMNRQNDRTPTSKNVPMFLLLTLTLSHSP